MPRGEGGMCEFQIDKYITHFTPKLKNVEKCISNVVRIGGIIIFYLSKL